MGVFHLRNLADRIKSFPSDKAGATMIIMALLLPFFLAGLAFGAEFAYFEMTKRRLQNATDTAAIAAGTQLRSGLGQSDMDAAALLVAGNSGYENSSGTLNVVSPPATGAYAGDTNAVKVTLTQTFDRFFSKVIVKQDLTLTTEATVLIANGRPACVLALDADADDAVAVGGSANVTLTGCDIAANSISESAVSTTGASADASVDCVSTVGKVDDFHNGITYNDCASPIEGSPVAADPYADVSEPTPSSCSGGASFTSGGGSTKTPSPGCYSVSGLNINSDIELSSGVYIFNGPGEVTLNGNKSMAGEGVTLFLANGASMKVNGNFDLSIKAPTNGTYSGLAIFGDRDDTGDLDLTGNSGVSIVGAIYSPDSAITYTGNTSEFTAGECTQVIGNTVTFWGDADFDTDCTNSGTKEIYAAESVRLVE